MDWFFKSKDDKPADEEVTKDDVDVDSCQVADGNNPIDSSTVEAPQKNQQQNTSLSKDEERQDDEQEGDNHQLTDYFIKEVEEDNKTTMNSNVNPNNKNESSNNVSMAARSAVPQSTIDFYNDAELKTNPSDLDLKLGPNDITLINEFDYAWSTFLRDNPHLIPTSKKTQRIEQLQLEIKKLKENKDQVENELKQQLGFFQKSFEQLDEKLQIEIKLAADEQEELYNKLQKQLDNVAISNHIMTFTLFWEYFLQVLDDTVEADERKTMKNKKKGSVSGSTTGTYSHCEMVESFGGKETVSSTTSRKYLVVKPSKRAMKLVTKAKDEKSKKTLDLSLLSVLSSFSFDSQMTGGSASVNNNKDERDDEPSKEDEFRGYYMDHALLSVEEKMLQKEIERYEKNIETLQFVGKFLTEHNIWGILTNGTNGSGGTVVGDNGTVYNPRSVAYLADNASVSTRGNYSLPPTRIHIKSKE